MKNLTWYADRLPCTDGEKQACLETVKALTQASCIARRDGLLMLEVLLESLDGPLPEWVKPMPRPDALFDCMRDPFFRDCLLDLVDGFERKALRKNGELLLAAGDYRGGAFLAHVLTIEGMDAIQSGKNSFGLFQTLFRWFGPGWRELVRETVDAEWDRFQAMQKEER